MMNQVVMREVKRVVMKEAMKKVVKKEVARNKKKERKVVNIQEAAHQVQVPPVEAQEKVLMEKK